MGLFSDAQLERVPCHRCGAHTLSEAETLCRPTSDQSGEYSCPGSEDDADEEGYLRQPTAAAWDELGRWCDEQARQMGQVVAERPGDAK